MRVDRRTVKLVESECTLCGEVKPRADYYLTSEGWKTQPCKVCCRKQSRARYWARKADDPEALAASMKRRARRYQVAKYGLTIDEYEGLVEAQDGCCMICGIEPEGNLAVDHCHETGEVRGLLCIACNVGIGNLRDDPELLKAAAEYLERYA